MNHSNFEIAFPKAMFISGTGTDVGKSFATGWLALQLIENGHDCITQKLIQTGNCGRSEDIELHRKIMKTGPFKEDMEQLTFPEVYTYPCSPDLAAKIDNRPINFEKIEEATKKLMESHEIVLIEGAGGLMVPLKDEYLTANYIKDHNYPLILVFSGELGSINHALLTLNAVKTYNLNLFGIIYNSFFDKDSVICEDTKRYLKLWTDNHFDNVNWWDMGIID